MSGTVGIRRRSDYADPRVGELARDADDGLRRLQAQLDILSAQLAELTANPPSGYSDEQAQDAVGGILVDTPSVDLEYDDAIPAITATVPEMIGDAGAGGVAGLVPAPAAGDAAAGYGLLADGTWGPVGGGGGSTVTVWMPEAPPAAPSALDDFFDGGGPSWTLFQHAGGYLTQTVDTSRHALLMTGTGSGSPRWEGRFQAIPGTEFVAYVWLGFMGVAGECDAGIVVSNGTANTSGFGGGFSVIRPPTTNNRMGYALVNNYTSALGSFSNDPSGLIGNWLRLRVTGVSAYNVDVSRDGWTWQHAKLDSTFPAIITHIGLVTTVYTGTCGVMFRNFQVIAGAGTSAFDATHIGQLVTVGV